ncbi:MAG: polyprenyl synthetase family protein [Verrucomicrobia bacterium]|nr:polyprenyl synthetase family protein [Verrucomicrobiota bacterium]
MTKPTGDKFMDELGAKLERYRSLVNDAHRELIHASPYGDRVGTILEAANRILLSREAKRVRGIIPLLLAEHGCCSQDYAVRCGVLVELLHFASLIHDDVIDEALERRHEPAVNALFGGPDAILVGDHFICEAIEYALRTPRNTEVIAACVGAIKSLIHGIFLERRLESEDLGFDVYRKMAELKTGVLFDLAFRLPMLGTPEAERAAHVGQEFGVLFQVYDDWFDRDIDPGWINAYKYLSREEGAEYCRTVFNDLVEDARQAGVLDVVALLVRWLQPHGYFGEASIEAR